MNRTKLRYTCGGVPPLFNREKRARKTNNAVRFRRTCSAAVILDKQPACCGRRRAGGIRSREYEAFHFCSRNFCGAPVQWDSPSKCAGNVTQEHNNPSRDGVYVDAAFTPSAAANLTRDLSFDGTVSGNVYAQPLYIEGGPNGPMIIAVTESNNVYALDAITGIVIWQRTDIGPPVTSGLPCGNINPVGITGTPVIDPASRRLSSTR